MARIPSGLQPVFHWDYSQNPTGIIARVLLGLQRVTNDEKDKEMKGIKNDILNVFHCCLLTL